MRASGRDGHSANVWPAFTDAMLAFVLVLVLMLVFYVGQRVVVVGPDQNQILSDQETVEELLDAFPGGGVSYRRGLGRHDLTFGSEALFESGSADLNAEGRQVLAALARSIAGRGVQTLQEISVSGHTDDVATAGTRFASNWELSTSRATEVVRFLAESGVDPETIGLSATGYGEYAPVLRERTEAARARNRRIEMRLVYSQDPPATDS